VKIEGLVRCEQCAGLATPDELKRYRATTPNGEQANITLCKPCVSYLRKEEYVRLKLLFHFKSFRS